MNSSIYTLEVRCDLLKHMTSPFHCHFPHHILNYLRIIVILCQRDQPSRFRTVDSTEHI